MFRTILLIFILFSTSIISKAEEDRLIIGSTTSTYDTGLLNYINKAFNEKYKIDIHVISFGTGQALEAAKQGNIDILLVHHTPSELNFMNQGYGFVRYDLMYNDYIIIGPKKSKFECNSIENFLIYVKKNNLIFVSRGDESGTHKKELEIWESYGYSSNLFSNWYIKNGQGMGATLMMANEIEAFTLTDRATWIFYNKKENLKIICENMPPLLNQYGIIGVNPNLNNNINYKWSKIYIDWLISNDGKKLINGYKVKNKQLFYYNYK